MSKTKVINMEEGASHRGGARGGAHTVRSLVVHIPLGHSWCQTQAVRRRRTLEIHFSGQKKTFSWLPEIHFSGQKTCPSLLCLTSYRTRALQDERNQVHLLDKGPEMATHNSTEDTVLPRMHEVVDLF